MRWRIAAEIRVVSRRALTNDRGVDNKYDFTAWIFCLVCYYQAGKIGRFDLLKKKIPKRKWLPTRGTKESCHKLAMESNRQRHRYTNGAKAMNTAFLALALMACFSGSSLATFDTGFGIAVLDITRTNLNPPLNTEWRLSVGLTNFLGM